MSNISVDLHIRVDQETKAEIEECGLPFDVRHPIPNAETLAAMQEVEEMKENPSLGKAYTDVDQMMRELLD